MTQKEKELFQNLCDFESEYFDTFLLAYAGPTVLGHLFFNRMAAIAYGTLKKHKLLSKVNREFRNSLYMAYEQNKQKNKSFFECIKHLNETLLDCKSPYAMLKGAVLCSQYPEGFRTANDIDLLVTPASTTEIGNALYKNGFRQGYIRNGEFIPATRREIIEAKMTRGETVPYIKEVNLPHMRYLEVDINFSLDYKSTVSNLLETMLADSIVSSTSIPVKTLSRKDFFLHLCAHLYKEATTLPWITMKRDMTLYKYCDIALMLSKMNVAEILSLFDRAKMFNLDDICAFAILETAALFNNVNSYAIKKANEALKDRPDFLHTVIAPIEKKFFIYEERDIRNRFFSEDRANLLKEVVSQ